MKKIFLILIAALLVVEPLYAVDDDSTPYMPFPEQPSQPAQPKAPTKKAPAKKKTTTKKNTKKTTKKAAPKKATPPRQTSLERGIALMQEERYEAAKPYLLKAIQENRNDPNAWYWYGVYHEKTGGYYQAQYFYSKAVTIDPAFEPLSRVVYYPNDNEKTPLWDPKRPARVYPVATHNDGLTVASSGNFPSVPNDPEIPQVPVYLPPEPGSNPLQGDSWAPAVYVPPNPDELLIREGTQPVYTPPEVQSVIAEPQEENVRMENYTYTIPGYSNTYVNRNEDSNVRADLPLYNPPEPGQTVAQAPAPRPEIKKAQTTKAAPEKVQPKTAPRKVVKQSDKKTTKKPAPKKQATTNKAPETPTRPTQQTQQAQPQRPQPQQQPAPERRQQQQTQPQQPSRPVQPERVPEPEITQPERRQPEYLPPVGQFSPDPGTVLEGPIPPVGQGSQY